MTTHTLQALAILAPAIVTAWLCRPRRTPATRRTLRLELASIRRAYDCRANLVHLGRPEILAILNARDDGRERREIPDLAARAIRLEHCLEADRTTAPIGRAARRRRRRSTRPTAMRPPRRDRYSGMLARALRAIDSILSSIGLRLWH